MLITLSLAIPVGTGYRGGVKVRIQGINSCDWYIIYTLPILDTLQKINSLLVSR